MKPKFKEKAELPFIVRRICQKVLDSAQWDSFEDNGDLYEGFWTSDLRFYLNPGQFAELREFVKAGGAK